MPEFFYDEPDNLEEEIPVQPMELPSDLPQREGLSYPFFERLQNEVELILIREALKHDDTEGNILPDVIRQKLWVQLPLWSKGLEGTTNSSQMHPRIQMSTDPHGLSIELAGLPYGTPEMEQESRDRVLKMIKDRYLDIPRSVLETEMPPERLRLLFANIGTEIDAIEQDYKRKNKAV